MRASTPAHVQYLQSTDQHMVSLEAASPHALPAQHPGCHRYLVYLLLLLNTSGSFLTSEQVMSPFDAHLLSWEAMQSFSQLIFTKSIVTSPQTNPPV